MKEPEKIYGQIPLHWEMVTLGELVAKGTANLQTGPFGTMLQASSYRISGTPVIAVQHFGDNRLNHNDMPRLDEDTVIRLSRYRLRENDILFARKGAIDKRVLIRKEEQGWLQGSDCIRLRLADTIDAQFVSFALGTPAYREWIIRHAQGATMPSLNQEILSLMPLPVPPFSEQSAIARILGALDDKIELSRRMNATLEAMAQSLFKSWFVDFDPVVAKMDGRQPYGMGVETAALFSDKLVESQIGPVPEGWRVSTIGTEVKVVGGSTPSTAEPKYWVGGTISWITPRDLSRFVDPVVLDTERKITDAGLEQISSGLLPQGTVLMSSRAPIGYLAVAEIPVAVNQGFIAMICDGRLPNHYALAWAKENMDEILSRSGGTTFGEISKTNFRPIPVIVPRKEILVEYEQRARILFSRLVLNLKETATLTSVRDTLLPRLLSGELRVKGAEEAVGKKV